jgi:hypothetical protein
VARTIPCQRPVRRDREDDHLHVFKAGLDSLKPRFGAGK